MPSASPARAVVLHRLPVLVAVVLSVVLAGCGTDIRGVSASGPPRHPVSPGANLSAAAPADPHRPAVRRRDTPPGQVRPTRRRTTGVPYVHNPALSRLLNRLRRDPALLRRDPGLLRRVPDLRFLVLDVPNDPPLRISPALARAARRVIRLRIDGQATVVILPRTPNGRAIVFAHGSDDTVDADIDTDRSGPTIDALVAAGYTWAESNAGFNNWGNPVSVRDDLGVVGWLRHHGIRTIDLGGDSMGGLDTTLLIPRVDPEAVFELFPVCDEATLDHLFGIDIRHARAPLEALSPVPVQGPRGTPILITASPQDTLVPKATNADVCAAEARAAGFAVDEVTTRGEHDDPSNWTPARLIAFLDRAASRARHRVAPVDADLAQSRETRRRPRELSTNTPGDRRVTVVDRADTTIWVAAWPGATDGRTGWRLAPGAQVSFTVPPHWNARLWGRTGCHFDAAGRGGCLTGDCGGRFQCRGWGAIPATLAEYDLDAYDHLDFYDVSMVDGSNLPMYINTVGGHTPDRISPEGCESGHGCTRPVRCPSALAVRHDRQLEACISPCARFGTDRYCCRGRFANGCSPARTWPIDYARVFKTAEPYAYSWSGDDATSTFTCAGDCGYRITFGLTPPAVGGPPG